MDLTQLSNIDENQAEAAAGMLAALASRRRLMILCSLVEGEKSVGELNERIPLSQSALSQHLARLRSENLVTTRRESQTIYYRISEPAVYEIIARLHERFCKAG